MNQLILSLGSNTNSEINMIDCRKKLSELFSNIVFSKTSLTMPYGDKYTLNFLNQLALINTNLGQRDIETILKKIEVEMGRSSNDKEQGIVKIDIDLIKWNETFLRSSEWERSYIKDLLPSLNENLIEQQLNQKSHL